jgi:hypothetical protein
VVVFLGFGPLSWVGCFSGGGGVVDIATLAICGERQYRQLDGPRGWAGFGLLSVCKFCFLLVLFLFWTFAVVV